MNRSFAVRAMMLGLVVALLAPAAAFADTYDAAGKGLPESVGINSIWVVVAACLVMFMQAGFAFLEIGFSRGKNAGTVVAKILTNFSIAAHPVLGRRLRVRVRRRPRPRHRHPRVLPARLRRSAEGVPDHGAVRRDDRGEVVVPVRLLRASRSRSSGARRSSASSSAST